MVIRVLFIYELGMMEFHVMEFYVNKNAMSYNRGSHIWEETPTTFLKAPTSLWWLSIYFFNLFPPMFSHIVVNYHCILISSTVGLRQGLIVVFIVMGFLFSFFGCHYGYHVDYPTFNKKWYTSNKNKNKSSFRRWGYSSDSYKFGGNNNNIYLHGLRRKNKVIKSNLIETLFIDIVSVMVVIPTTLLGALVAIWRDFLVAV